jgi:hypothetical protein
VHVAEQPGRDAKAPFERVVETDRRQTDFRCDALERQLSIDQRARRFKTQRLDKMRR